MLFVLAARRVVVDAGTLIKNINKKNNCTGGEDTGSGGGTKKKEEKNTPRRSEVTGCDRAVKTQSRNQLSEAAEHRGGLREPNS